MATHRVPSIRFYQENGLDEPDESDSIPPNSRLVGQEESSNSSDFLFPRNLQNAIDSLREDDSSLSDQENRQDGDVDYCPLPIELEEEEDDEEEYASDPDESELPQPKKGEKRKKAPKRNPYQNNRKIKKQKIHTEDLVNSEDEDAEIEYTELENGFKLPSKLWQKLYPYQQAGIRWLWELHQQSTGGILGDEPGLL